MASLLKIIVSLAGPYRDVETLVTKALGNGWDVQVFLTPNAATGFKDEDLIQQLENLTKKPVRHELQTPKSGSHTDQVKQVIRRQAVIVAPASFNIISKLALGLCDDLATTEATLMIGQACRPDNTASVVLVPHVNVDLATHFLFQEHLERLRRIKVDIVPRKPHESGESEDSSFPWDAALQLVEEKLGKPEANSNNISIDDGNDV